MLSFPQTSCVRLDWKVDLTLLTQAACCDFTHKKTADERVKQVLCNGWEQITLLMCEHCSVIFIFNYLRPCLFLCFIFGYVHDCYASCDCAISLARQWTMEDEEEVEREKRRRVKSLSSSADPDADLNQASGDTPTTGTDSTSETSQGLSRLFSWFSKTEFIYLFWPKLHLWAKSVAAPYVFLVWKSATGMLVRVHFLWWCTSVNEYLKHREIIITFLPHGSTSSV